MSRGDRALRRPLALAVVAAVLLTLTSWGGTHAAWDASRGVALDPVRNAAMVLDATAPADSTFSGTTSSSVISTQVVPSRLSGTSTGTGVAQAQGWNSGLAAQVTLGYTPRGTSGLDLLVSSTTLQGNAFVRSHAGAGVRVDTTVTTTASPPRRWSAQDTVTTRHAVPFPRPTHPGATLTLGAVCQSSTTLTSAQIRWSWAGAATTTDSPAVAAWRLQRLSSGQWVNIGSATSDGRPRSISVPGSLLPQSTFDVRIVAVPANATLSPVPATFTVRVERGLLGGVSCISAEPAP
ncbi:hypothetical protein ACI3EY_15960 [Ornithinimicrobium sp. LYQ92]|uniref:hypothetical protein n=1 Tax=Serinicoccus sp. LYQ92 TaxID=3378798 RepID=UPI003854C895